MFFLVCVTDWGMMMNKTLGRSYYLPGEILQVVMSILGELVWIEQGKQIDGELLYRVSFGPSPFFTQQITEQEVISQIVQHFARFELVEVSSC